MGQLTISLAILNSKLLVYQRVIHVNTKHGSCNLESLSQRLRVFRLLRSSGCCARCRAEQRPMGHPVSRGQIGQTSGDWRHCNGGTWGYRASLFSESWWCFSVCFLSWQLLLCCDRCGDVWSHHRQAAVQSGSVVICVLVSICFNGSGGILHFTFHIDVTNLILSHYDSL